MNYIYRNGDVQKFDNLHIVIIHDVLGLKIRDVVSDSGITQKVSKIV